MAVEAASVRVAPAPRPRGRGLRRDIGFIGLLWWDIAAVTAFSLAIYLWALRVALPAEKIEALIERDAVR